MFSFDTWKGQNGISRLRTCSMHLNCLTNHLWGARKKPWKTARIISPDVERQLTPSPGADKRAAASTHFFLPATYPPHGATAVPPGFFIKLPGSGNQICTLPHH
ncbi:hypothetical protein V6N13_117670 [Hibiscus sabdariffa]|uniref:Uncharacterized protein n=2 Tax=Hibiscus sabdariffa TaxID=183260 RepID=A0ABR2A1J6_9ROSI